MNKFMFNVKQLKMSKFIRYIWQLIISTSNATLKVPSLLPWAEALRQVLSQYWLDKIRKAFSS